MTSSHILTINHSVPYPGRTRARSFAVAATAERPGRTGRSSFRVLARGRRVDAEATPGNGDVARSKARLNGGFMHRERAIDGDGCRMSLHVCCAQVFRGLGLFPVGLHHWPASFGASQVS
jgi:hypothetical protein